jgi:hypothetical protein
MQHLQFLASELAQEQMPPETMQRIQQVQQQLAQMPIDQQQQAAQQIQMLLDQFAAPIMAQLSEEFLQSIGQGGDDPLVAIRQAEVELRNKQIDQEQSQFEAQQDQRAQEKLLENELQKQRINVQKEVADDKLDVALQRLDQQADLKLLELEQKMRG